MPLADSFPWFSAPTKNLVLARLRVPGSDGSPVPARAEIDYFHVRVAQMFLTHRTRWFQSWFPTVHSVVRCEFGQGPPLELPYVGQPAPADGDTDVVARNLLLTPAAVPFRGGRVHLDVALVAIAGQNYLGSFLSLLSTASEILALPQVGAALKLVAPVQSGVLDLLGAQGNQVHLKHTEDYLEGELRPGYVAVVRAAADEVDPSDLVVIDDELHVAGPHGPTPLQSHDFVLLRFGVQQERPDWASLAEIIDPYNAALDAVEEGAQARAQFLLNTARQAARRSPALTQADRRRVVDQLGQHFAESVQSAGTSRLLPSSPGGLEEFMAGAPSAPDALELGEPSELEALAPAF